MNFYSDLTELGSFYIFGDHDANDAIKIRINKQIVFKLSVIVCFARTARIRGRLKPSASARVYKLPIFMGH